MPTRSNPNLNYLRVRLDGMENAVKLTPGYLAWRDEAVGQHGWEVADRRRSRLELDRRLGGEAMDRATDSEKYKPAAEQPEA